ncbi:MAG: SusE domain-containing protein, partial [Bacteroidales bacterium]|nr:SusE domain-containing protein [Bacteroidales bacterium]
MKTFKYLLSVLAFASIALSCTHDPEAYSLKEAVAPVMNDHAMILVTETTMNENVTFTWSRARVPGNQEISYVLYGQYGDNAVQTFGNSAVPEITMSKSDFNTAVINAGAPGTDKFSMKFKVEAFYGDSSITSAPIDVTITSQGDLVAPVSELESTEISLSSENWDSNVVFDWDAAKLEYGASITYNVYLTYTGGTKSDVSDSNQLIGTTTDETTLSLTQEKLNDIVLGMGAAEGESASMEFYVTASSEEYPDGLESAHQAITVTTYSANYPDKFYLPGNYQSWNPAGEDCAVINVTTSSKGIYESVVDLTTSDGSDAEFKFNPDQSWSEKDFGASVTVETDGTTGTVTASGKANVGDNIKVPSGIWRIYLNYKTKDLEMTKINSLGIIGDFNSWGSQVNLTFDKATGIWSGNATISNGDGYKFRINDDWNWSIGSDGGFNAGGNFTFDKTTGEYKVMLNTSVYPYTVSFASTDYPDALYIPGNHQGWAPAAAPSLLNDNDGYYEGYVNLVNSSDASSNCEFKFTTAGDWSHTNYGGTVIDGGNGTYTA